MGCVKHITSHSDCRWCKQTEWSDEADRVSKKHARRMSRVFEQAREDNRRDRERERSEAEDRTWAARQPPRPTRVKSAARVELERTFGRIAAYVLAAGAGVTVAVKTLDVLAFALGPLLLLAAGGLLVTRRTAAGPALIPRVSDRTLQAGAGLGALLLLSLLPGAFGALALLGVCGALVALAGPTALRWYRLHRQPAPPTTAESGLPGQASAESPAA